MNIRLRDEAILLEPATKTDRYTQETVPDWTADPASATPVEFAGFPITSTEEVLTAGTIVARWSGYLGRWLDGIVDPRFRIRWDGDDFEIDGDVERWKKGSEVRYLALTLKRVS